MDGFELLGAHTAEVTVATRAIVERFDVVGDFPGRLVSVFVDSFLDSFFLETFEERLRYRVVPAVSSAAHAGLRAISLAAARELAEVMVQLLHVARSRDPGDNFLLAMAEASNAEYLVSGEEREVLALKSQGPTHIVTTRRMLSILDL